MNDRIVEMLNLLCIERTSVDNDYKDGYIQQKEYIRLKAKYDERINTLKWVLKLYDEDNDLFTIEEIFLKGE